jgi:hypothetical protein
MKLLLLMQNTVATSYQLLAKIRTWYIKYELENASYQENWVFLGISRALSSKLTDS